MQELANAREGAEFVASLQKKLTEQQAFLSMAAEEGDTEIAMAAAQDLGDIEKIIASKEKEARFNGPHDRSAAIITIQAGAGGTDAHDWGEMLERMYVRFAEQQGWKTKIIDRPAGDIAGIKHSAFEIDGTYVYGLLKGEHGVHRLVRLSPFNADHLRQTSFARVEVIPKLTAAEAPVIDEQDLEIDTFRAGGAGGQHVNKTSSAVRIRHIPTGITVKCQNERSQAQNKAQALAVLQAKLAAVAQQQHVATIDELRGEIKEAAWGNQIRSYVLHPYRLVKDHRTKKETTDVEGVLNGDLQLFLSEPAT